MTTVRQVRRFGDGGLVVDVASVRDAQALAAAIGIAQGWTGIEDVVVGYRSVVVVADPSMADLASMAEDLAGMPAVGRETTSRRTVEIGVRFDGPDLDEVGALASMTPAGVIGQLLEAELTVAFLGFLPGFAYLEGLPDALAAVPRRSTPRTAVPPGSFAIGGGFAGIYPRASPGGWRLLGRTGFELFDPEVAPFAALHPGDTVRLHLEDGPSATAGAAPEVTARPGLRWSGPDTVEVTAPGLLTMVQDLGRIGVASLGVPRAGAADLYTARIANRLVGNEDGAGVVEVTGLGPRMRFDTSTHVTVVGRAEASVDGRPVAPDTVVPISAGQELAVGATRDDLRCYIAVAGGFEVAPVLGSRSSDVLTGLGPGALRSGDVLGIGAASRPRGQVVGGDRARADGGTRVVRVLAGPDELATDAADRLGATRWEVDGASDRMGVRLDGDEPVGLGTTGTSSRGMVTGAVQVPPDGRPVVLLCDHATVGGYPVAATVVRADLGVLGQLRPGDPVRFEVVDLDEATRARAQAERALDRAVVGWFPVRSD
ncbi:MAG TPA: carboxyltransferase domain-containing protein [Acidimicrobiales bacterium]|nr:carboxyltransferase domain-containing protein [Acidimicrobiales bacterium]